MRRAVQLLEPLHPSQSALTPLLEANLDQGMLREIAEADYGFEAGHCLQLLDPILHGGAVALEEFCVREVLELIRFSEPEIDNWSPGGKGKRGHWMRLFACAALVRAAPLDPETFSSESDTLAPLVASAIHLGEPAARAAASLLAWRFLAYPGSDQDPAFFAFAILLLSASVERAEDRGAWLAGLASWVEEEEARARTGLVDDEWLLGLCVYRDAPYSQGAAHFIMTRAAAWRELAHSILTDPQRPHPGEADRALRRLGARIPKIKP